MRFRKVLLLGIIIVTAIFVAYSKAPTLEKELYWYQSEGFSIYRHSYIDFLDELPANRTLSENRVSRLSLRQWVPVHEGVVYYCPELEILYCMEVPESSAWVYVYFTEIDKWLTYWHSAPG